MLPCIDLLAFKDGVLFTRVGTDLYSYDFGSEKMKKLCELDDWHCLYSPIVVPYSMSLAPLAPV